jgi:hypothetical protein
MKKFVLLFFCFLLFWCCKTQYKLPCNKTETIIYKPLIQSKGFIIDVPQNYSTIFTEGGNSYGYGFVYKDNMLLYIDDELSFNWNSEKKIGTANFSDIYNKIISAEYLTIPNCDTLISEGIIDSLYWKEIFIYWNSPPSFEVVNDSNVHDKIITNNNSKYFTYLYVGYMNIPRSSKELFDNSLISLRLLEDTTIKRDPIITKLIKKKGKHSAF